MFNISAFTHIGTSRSSNQDHILVNGEVINSGEIHLLNQQDCICFVADGVGGNNAGDFASRFVLEKIKLLSNYEDFAVETSLRKINELLISESKTRENLFGAATTLTGVIIKKNIFKVIHSGDSQLCILRNDMFFQVTNDQVLNEYEQNSPITSYFGGFNDCLKLDNEISISESIVDDIFFICSDGLFKSISHKIVKSILKADKDIETKAKKILENCLQSGAEDNVSVIIIKKIN